MLSLPALLVLTWGIAGLLWWDRRRQVIRPEQAAWTMAAMALVAIAMALALVSLPAPPVEQLLRGVLMIEAIYGFRVLARRRNGLR
ncbi:MAG: hypothetical protein V1750_03505 [Acidobacteriota bacterium]